MIRKLKADGHMTNYIPLPKLVNLTLEYSVDRGKRKPLLAKGRIEE